MAPYGGQLKVYPLHALLAEVSAQEVPQRIDPRKKAEPRRKKKGQAPSKMSRNNKIVTVYFAILDAT